MSDHGHDSHGHDHGSHDAHDHGAHGDDHRHDDHGHGHEHWGDYNAQPPAPSTLPPLTAAHLSVLGIALAVLLAAIVGYSLRLSEARGHGEHAEGHGEKTEAHGESSHEKAEHKPAEKESKKHH